MRDNIKLVSMDTKKIRAEIKKLDPPKTTTKAMLRAEKGLKACGLSFKQLMESLK